MEDLWEDEIQTILDDYISDKITREEARQKLDQYILEDPDRIDDMLYAAENMK